MIVASFGKYRKYFASVEARMEAKILPEKRQKAAESGNGGKEKRPSRAWKGVSAGCSGGFLRARGRATFSCL
ncbi:MAG: hypothetical protein IJ363_13975 [Clostridia bacterium]|nr:hypothetical protein [Clostridia bacterium]